jgi:glycosyltransferase involved in cell wall biosynthesis
MKISIVTVVKDDAEYIEETISSVLSQSWGDIEYIVLDGDSKDGTREIIEKHQNNIDYFSSEPDGGVYHAMNKSLEHITGDFVCFMNSGDEFYDDDVVSKLVGHLDGVDLLFGDTIIIDGHDEIYKKASLGEKIYREMPICHQSLFVKSTYMKKTGFNQSYKVLADYDFVLKSFENNKIFFYLNSPISRYRLGGMSAKNIFQMDLEGVAILNNKLPMGANLLPSSPHFKRLEKYFLYHFSKRQNDQTFKVLFKLAIKALARKWIRKIKEIIHSASISAPKLCDQYDVVHFSTYNKNGGAGRAASRIVESLRNHSEIKCTLISSAVENNNLQGIQYKKSRLANMLGRLLNGRILNRYGIKELEANTPLSVGLKNCFNGIGRYFKNSKILHFHWVSGDFVSISSIESAIKKNKKIVITLHDMWFVTGLCHNPINCYRYESGCGECPALSSSSVDPSSELAAIKKKVFEEGDVTLVAPSNWMKNVAKNSYIGNNLKIECVPNPIDTKKFFCIPNNQLCSNGVSFYNPNKRRLLFGAHTNALYKGSNYVIDALMLLADSGALKGVEVVAYGRYDKFSFDSLKEKCIVHEVGFISDFETLRAVYSAVDYFVSGSIQESFGLVLTEAMSCETACIAFASSGALDIIDHEDNGLLADYESTISLANNMEKMFSMDDVTLQNMKNKARKKCIDFFDYSIVSEKYSEIYEKL